MLDCFYYLSFAILCNQRSIQFMDISVLRHRNTALGCRLGLCTVFLKTVGIIAGIAVISRYYLFPALAVMDDDMLLLEAIHVSVMVSRRSVAAFLGLVISFIPLILISLFALPIFYTAPIFFSAYAIHSRYALVNYNQNLDNYKKQNFTF